MTRRALFRFALAAAAPQPVCWLKLNLMSGAQTLFWPDAGKPIGFGSLLKPFLVLAFSATHESFPVVGCHGKIDRCWSVRGHGLQDVVSGLANSCNAYFVHLVRGVDRAALDALCLSYGLAIPARTLSAEQLIGLGEGWTNTPSAVVQAFARLNREKKTAVALRGMERCAQSGTAKLLHLSCYAKTGTAPCSHSPRAPGDGFVALLYPKREPRTALLVQHHGTTGAETCRDARSLL